MVGAVDVSGGAESDRVRRMVWTTVGDRLRLPPLRSRVDGGWFGVGCPVKSGVGVRCEGEELRGVLERGERGGRGGRVRR